VTLGRRRVGLLIAPLTVAAAVLLHAWIDVPRGSVQPRVSKQSKAKKKAATKKAATKSTNPPAASEAQVTRDPPRDGSPKRVGSSGR
jgi:hypothetical protein